MLVGESANLERASVVCRVERFCVVVVSMMTRWVGRGIRGEASLRRMEERREIGWYERVMNVIGLDWCERRSVICCLVNVSGKPMQLRVML